MKYPGDSLPIRRCWKLAFLSGVMMADYSIPGKISTRPFLHAGLFICIFK